MLDLPSQIESLDLQTIRRMVGKASLCELLVANYVQVYGVEVSTCSQSSNACFAVHSPGGAYPSESRNGAVC